MTPGMAAAEDTRSGLVRAAFLEMWRHGYQSAGLDRILAGAGVTKGALYHHFKNKLELGYAVVDELIAPFVRQRWSVILDAEDPLTAIAAALRDCPVPDELAGDYLSCGCPLNNLAQEMSPIDEGFRQRIHAVFEDWKRILSEALVQGQKNGTVRDNIDTHRAATFIVAVAEGAIGTAKNEQNTDILEVCHEGLTHYLEALRPRRSFRTTT